MPPAIYGTGMKIAFKFYDKYHKKNKNEKIKGKKEKGSFLTFLLSTIFCFVPKNIKSPYTDFFEMILSVYGDFSVQVHLAVIVYQVLFYFY